jgi:hypothetical protein
MKIKGFSLSAIFTIASFFLLSMPGCTDENEFTAKFEVVVIGPGLDCGLWVIEFYEERLATNTRIDRKFKLGQVFRL